MDLNLKDKTAIISGGVGGIGQCIAREFLAEGAQVVVADVDGEKGEQFEAECSAAYGDKRLKFVQTDVTVPNQIRSLFVQAHDFWGRIDILINAHQWWPFAWFKDITDEDWQRCLDINLASYFYLCREAVNYFLAHGIKGKILNITSQAAFRGSTTGHAHYAAAKAGIVGLTMSIAREVASHGINVIGLAPGMVETPSTEEALKVNRAQYESRIPLGRIAKSEEIAGVAVFLMSEKANYITGATIDISGGILMR